MHAPVRGVVDRSGSRQYQMFLRFALNRGMLLVDELERHVNMNDIGAQENLLDILEKAIKVGLEFYESDLAFQQRAQAGNTAITLPYAQFGVAFMRAMYPGVVNVLDASAQYRLLHKLIEMVNWDLSRDANANRYAETIVETHEMTVDLPEQPLSDDRANLRMIRRLNGLGIISLQQPVPAPETLSSSASTDSGDISTYADPVMFGLNISSDADPNGTCKALGHQSAVANSVTTTTHSSPRETLLLTENAHPILKQDLVYEGYITSIACTGTGRPAAWKIVVIESPRRQGAMFASTSSFVGVCRALGYSDHLHLGWNVGLAPTGRNIVVNEQGQVSGHGPADRRGIIDKIYCIQ